MKEISYKELSFNPMTLVGDDWLVLCAGNEEEYNGMTISWGHMGTIWHDANRKYQLPTVCVYVRPQRYTKKFMDEEEYFTVNLLSKENRKAHGVFGNESGKDGNKFEKTGLHPEFSDGTIHIQEAEMVFVCRKVFTQDLKEEGFVDKNIVDVDYPEKDFHTMYIGEITKVLVKE